MRFVQASPFGMILAVSLASLPACQESSVETAARYLYVWAGDVDGADPDFLAVVDADPTSDGYGSIINTEPVRSRESLPHHTEYDLPPVGTYLFANAHRTEEVLLIDFQDPIRPQVVRTLDAVPPYRYPHDMVRMPNGNVLVGYLRSDGPSPLPADTTLPGGHGGIAEFTPDGELVRAVSAADDVTDVPIRPYSFAMLPAIDRMVLTSAPMVEPYSADVVQTWRLSSLELLHTLPVPPARLANGELLQTEHRGVLQPTGHRYPFEPRVMPDGSVLLNAYGCGFYRVTQIDSDAPRLEHVYTIEVPSSADLGGCGIPVVAGDYWIMTVGAAAMLVTLDISDPSEPREVSRLPTEDGFAPHWLAKDPGSNRLIVGAENEIGGGDRMLMVIFDPLTGELSWDETLRAKQGFPRIDFRRTSWPHGDTGEALAHAALFRP